MYIMYIYIYMCTLHMACFAGEKAHETSVANPQM